MRALADGLAGAGLDAVLMSTAPGFVSARSRSEMRPCVFAVAGTCKVTTGLAKRCFEASVSKAETVCCRFVGAGVDRDDFHGKAPSDLDHAHADASGADDGDRLILEFKAAKAGLIEAAALGALGGVSDLARKAVEQRKHLLSHSRIATSRHVANGDAVALAVAKVDVIKAVERVVMSLRWARRLRTRASSRD